MENKKSKIKNENFFQVSGWMLNELNLKGISLIVYAIIYGFTQDGETQFEGSRQYLCDFTGVSKPTIDKALNELCDSNLIIKISETKNNITFNKFKINVDMLNFTTSKETLSVGSKETLPNNNNLDNIDINNKDKNIHIKENIKRNPVEEILEYWNSKEIIKHKENDDIKNAISKVLKENTEDEIKLSIDHYSEVLKSDFFFNYKWSLVDFLTRKRGYKSFLDDGSNWVNYLEWKKNPDSKSTYNNNPKGIVKKKLTKFEEEYFANEEKRFYEGK